MILTMPQAFSATNIQIDRCLLCEHQTAPQIGNRKVVTGWNHEQEISCFRIIWLWECG